MGAVRAHSHRALRPVREARGVGRVLSRLSAGLRMGSARSLRVGPEPAGVPASAAALLRAAPDMPAAQTQAALPAHRLRLQAAKTQALRARGLRLQAKAL